MTKRLAIFALTGLTTFVIGVLVARNAPDLFITKHECRGNRMVLRSELRDLLAWQELRSFENHDLRRLDQESAPALRNAIDALRGKVDRPGVMPAFEPALFRLISSTSGQQRYILVEESQIMIIPGSSDLRIHVFDTHGVLLNAQEYSMYRTTLKRVHFRKVAAMNHEVLMVETMYCLGGNEASEFYALVGNQLRPVYLEGESGFEASADPQVQRSVEDWEESLRSHDEGEVMSALMWLGANRRTTYSEHEEQKASTLLSRNGVLQRLRELSRSENQWKKTAARYILRTL